jgi:hypothetical protein
MDELIALRALVREVPVRDPLAEAEVWRRLGNPHRERRRLSHPRALVLSGVAIALGLAVTTLIVRSSGIGVRTAQAACRASTSPYACARLLADALLPSRSLVGSSGSSKIVYSSFRTQSRADIFTTDGQGHVRRLTNGPGVAAFPAWSPDGTRIAFDWTLRGVESGIYVMRADGSHKELLARGTWSFPTWSPDGTKIAFWRGEHIYVAERSGGRVRVIKTRGWSPSWSPDGTQIVFGGSGRGNGEIYVMNADGSGRRLLAEGFFPSWSPDGKTIAYHGPQLAGDHTQPIWTMRADGSAERRLGVRTWVDCGLAWTPRGEIAYSNPSGLFLVAPHRQRVKRIGSGQVCGLSWQPARR